MGGFDRERCCRLLSSFHRGNPHFVKTVEAFESMCYPFCLLVSQVGQVWVVARDPVRGPIRLAMANEEEVHVSKTNQGPTRVPRSRLRLRDRRGYHEPVSRSALIEHLRIHGLRLDGPFTLRSGEISDWYLDARQTTFDGHGARLVGAAVLEVLAADVEAVGGMTMGADPIAIATAIVASEKGRPLQAFSIRKTEKSHGVGGRLVGPVSSGSRVAILEDTTTTGSAAGEATDVAESAGLIVSQAIALVDRSNGVARHRFSERGIDHIALVGPADLGVAL